ncbi:hypothetical protein GUITHDRAFT_164579 [Guillardia theta CCMP2712]|uniref:Uncharacterized protein n=1 Tax=Guillardia theta (strain CCMP2712) TaxID=905079 RepID=L1IXB4_GUITC|nr:hypothetical protein GUITHDRAFT_164579 [Guillardia theta CCMP2712]EKX40903.1 hypothetical protein GUITHDRAFT_164579 [Guillardia theta CCMP2712]|eukprot:XP_005827883.1 hypothetical protein GUITHDRAFT_164579 [Guillardia theta CCMP2712]
MATSAPSLSDPNWQYGMGGWNNPRLPNFNLHDPTVIAVDWLGFLCLLGASLALMYKLMSFKGPDGDQEFFVGYREEKCLSIYVNLIAAITYWGRICAHFNNDMGLSLSVNYFKYLDYIFTCPILTLDLLWSLNLPYKITYSLFVGLTIACGVFCNAFEPPARYLWFMFGCFIFAFTWISIIRLVYARFQQFLNEDAKKIRAPLKLSLTLYFSIWCGYPALWLLTEFGAISQLAAHVMTVIMDVAAKSVYGFALLKFQLGVDKRDVWLDELRSVRYSEPPPQIRPSKSREGPAGYNYDEEHDFPRFSKSSNRPHDMRHSRGSEHASRQRPPQDLYPHDDGNGMEKDQEISSTMKQIAELNKQLSALQDDERM